MDPPLTTPDAYIQQVAWSGVQPSTDRRGKPSRVGDTMAGAEEDIIADQAVAGWGPTDLGGEDIGL